MDRAVVAWETAPLRLLFSVDFSGSGSAATGCKEAAPMREASGFDAGVGSFEGADVLVVPDKGESMSVSSLVVGDGLRASGNLRWYRCKN